MELPTAVFLVGLLGLRIRLRLYHGTALLSHRLEYVALLGQQVWKPLVRCIRVVLQNRVSGPRHPALAHLRVDCLLRSP